MEQHRLKEVLSYNPDDGSWIWINPPKQHPRLKGCNAGTKRPSRGLYYLKIRVDHKVYSAHRLAFLYMEGFMPKIVDHINGNTLDNRWNNLRPVTQNQNAWNTKIFKKRSNLPMGVRFNASGNYGARIAYYNKTLYLGTYSTPEEASFVYLKKRRELFGEYNRL